MTSITPIKYKISLKPDLNSFTFDGQVIIDFRMLKSEKTITLNSLELDIKSCSILSDDKLTPANFSLVPEKETLEINLPENIQNEFSIQIDYKGSINDKMAGFYRSRYTENGETKYITVTQFQESSARMAFPCIDHPVHKAVFELEMTIPLELNGISNTLPEKEEKIDAKSKRIYFKPTPKMSTYLLFFGYGDFRMLRDSIDKRVRLLRLPGPDNTEEPGLTYGRQALKYCEDFYGIPYPLEKMDLIAVPDFAFGAMENWGAITFRENLLLYFEGITSKAARQRIFEVSAHEIAHQWFGDLVTPSDWKYLWLNESFATYFGYRVMAHYQPDWDIWQQFLHIETASAMARDGLHDTIAIEIPGGDNIIINSSTAPIIYNKGASMLRMLEGYIGTENYRKGVREYLSSHQYGCAESGHLWEAFEKASSQPVSDILINWVGQPGYPLITVKRKGNILILRQERFTYITKKYNQKWQIPVTLSVWDNSKNKQEYTFLFADEEHEFSLPENVFCYKINNDQTGFFRTCYDDIANLKKLGEMIHAGSLSPEDRWGIQNDLYALVRSGKLSLSEFINFLKYYEEEKEYLPLISISENLFQAMLVCENEETISQAGRDIAERILNDIGLNPTNDEPVTISGLRDQLVWYAVLWKSVKVIDFLLAEFEKMKSGAAVHPDIAESVMQAGAWVNGRDALGWLMKRFKESQSEHERINILTAFGSFKDSKLIEEALAFSLEKVPPRNRYMPIAAAAINLESQSFLWEWYIANLDKLEQMHPLLYERVITSIWPYGGLGREQDVIAFGNEYIKKHPEFTDAVKLALENLKINSQMRGK